MTLEELQQIRDASDEDKLMVAQLSNFHGDIDEINEWLDNAINDLQETTNGQLDINGPEDG